MTKKEKLAAPIPGSKIVVEKDWIVEISLGTLCFLNYCILCKKHQVLICLLPDKNRNQYLLPFWSVWNVNSEHRKDRIATISLVRYGTYRYFVCVQLSNILNRIFFWSVNKKPPRGADKLKILLVWKLKKPSKFLMMTFAYCYRICLFYFNLICISGDQNRLASMNAVFRTIDLTCLTATPILAGFLFTYANYGRNQCHISSSFSNHRPDLSPVSRYAHLGGIPVHLCQLR